MRLVSEDGDDDEKEEEGNEKRIGLRKKPPVFEVGLTGRSSACTSRFSCILETPEVVPKPEVRLDEELENRLDCAKVGGDHASKGNKLPFVSSSFKTLPQGELNFLDPNLCSLILCFHISLSSSESRMSLFSKLLREKICGGSSEEIECVIITPSRPTDARYLQPGQTASISNTPLYVLLKQPVRRGMCSPSSLTMCLAKSHCSVTRSWPLWPHLVKTVLEIWHMVMTAEKFPVDYTLKKESTLAPVI